MNEFTATNHAMMVGWIARAVVKTVGEKEGERIVRKAVKKYANQRGTRMALRAKSDGNKLTMDTYMAYSEWSAHKGEVKQKILEKTPDVRIQISKCPWYTAWKENGLAQYGRYFCLEVDKSLVQGFNEKLDINVNKTMPNGHEACDLLFKDANLSAYYMLKLLYRKAVKPGKSAVMSWEYHVGHLYKTMGEVIVSELGEPGSEIMAVALENFREKYGEKAVQIIKQYENTDFTRP